MNSSVTAERCKAAMGSAVVKSVIRCSEILDSYLDVTVQSLHSDGQEA